MDEHIGGKTITKNKTVISIKIIEEYDWEVVQDSCLVLPCSISKCGQFIMMAPFFILYIFRFYLFFYIVLFFTIKKVKPLFLSEGKKKPPNNLM